MLKDNLASVIGRNNYVRYIMFTTKLWHSFRAFGHPASNLIRQVFIPRGGVVFDIGANIGKFTGLAARAAGKTGRVFSFEPLPFVFRVLKAMVFLRRFRQVTLVEAALAEKGGRAEFTVPLKDGWKPLAPIAHLGGTVETNVMRISVEVKKLDGYIEKENLSRIDFIKCDTEGGEYAVFSGALRTLEKYRPVVFCEIYEEYLARQNRRPSEVFDLFKPLGFRAFSCNPDGTVKPVEKYEGPNDYFFIHPSRRLDAAMAPFISAP